MDTFWFKSIIVTPTPKIVKLRRVAQIILFASKQNICSQLFLIFKTKIPYFYDKNTSSLLVKGYMAVFVWSNT